MKHHCKRIYIIIPRTDNYFKKILFLTRRVRQRRTISQGRLLSNGVRKSVSYKPKGNKMIEVLVLLVYQGRIKKSKMIIWHYYVSEVVFRCARGAPYDNNDDNNKQYAFPFSGVGCANGAPFYQVDIICF